MIQSLVLYGLYPFVVERLDSLIEASFYVGISVYRCGNQLRSECHVVDDIE